MKGMFKLACRRGLWLVALAWMLGTGMAGMTGCSCEQDPLPPPPPAEISISPKSWVIAKKDLVIIPGVDFRVYGKFVITHASAKKDAEELEIKSIGIQKKTADSKAEFTLITKTCPEKFTAATDEEKKAKGCNPTDCMILSGQDVFCAALPLSLPQKLKVGAKGLEFVVEFKPSSDGIVPIADIEVVSNVKNPDTPDVPQSTTRVRISAQAGEPEIVVSIGGGKLKDEQSRSRWGYSFAPTKEGEKASQSFSVSNNGDGVLDYSFTWDSGSEDPAKSFDVVDEQGKSVLGKKLTMDPKQLANYKLTFLPKDCDDHTTILRIDSNAITKDYGEGVLKSAKSLFFDMRGSSPASAAVDPNALVFDNVKPNTQAKKTFKISLGPQSLCSLKIYSLAFSAENPRDPKPKDYSFGDMLKNGSKVSAPTAASPLTLAKGEELVVEVVYSPLIAGGESAVVLLDSNDKTIGERIVTIAGSTTSQIKPQARIKFLCGEDDIKTGNNIRCKTGGDVIAREVDLEAKKSIKIVVDGSESHSVPKGVKKIIKYTWELVLLPRGSKAVITPDPQDQTKAILIVDKGDATGTAVYKVKLTVEDEDNLKGESTEDLIVYGL